MKYLLWGVCLTPVLLLAVFITLKLCKVIAWSWWWVCAPLWMPLVLIIVLAIYVVYVLKHENIDMSEYDWQ